MPLYIAKSGDLDRCHRCLTDWQSLKDRATQLLIKYKGGALVTQFDILKWDFFLSGAQGRSWGWPWMSSRRRGTREEFAFVTWKEVQFWCNWCFAFLFRDHPLRFAIGNTCIKSDLSFWTFPNYFSTPRPPPHLKQVIWDNFRQTR